MPTSSSAQSTSVIARGSKTPRLLVDRFAECFSPLDYGAKCDGVTDDTQAWKDLLAALPAKGGVCIFMPMGTSMVNMGIIKLPDSTMLDGFGYGVSRIRANNSKANSFLVDVSGASQFVVQSQNQIANVSLHGGDAGGGSFLLRAYYNEHSVFENMFIDSCDVGFLDAVQFWDARIRNIQGGYWGTSANAVGMWFRNSASADPKAFGYSTDSSNQVVIDGVRAETFFGTGLRIERGPGSTSSPYNFMVRNFKAESVKATTSPFVYLGAGVTKSTFEDFYIAMDKLADPTTAPVNAFENRGGGINVFNKIRVYQGDSGVVAAPFYQASTGIDELKNITYEGQNGPSAAAVIVCANNTPGFVRPTISGIVYGYPNVPPVTGLDYNVTSAITVSTTDTLVRLDASAGAFSITLPDPKLCGGRPLALLKADPSGTPVTVVSPQGVNGYGSFTIENYNACVILLPNSAGWTIMASASFKTLGKQLVVSDGRDQIIVKGYTNGDQQLLLGYDTGGDYGRMQAIHQGVAYVPLRVQPDGGDINLIGGGGDLYINSKSYASDAAAGAAGLKSGAAFWLNGTTLTKKA